MDHEDGHPPVPVDELVTRLDIAWMAEVEAPARLEVILRRKDGKLLVNLINRGAGEMLSPQRVIVDELPPVHDVVVRLRCAQRPQSVTIVPEEPEIDWSYADGRVTVRVPRVDIHSVVVVAEQPVA